MKKFVYILILLSFFGFKNLNAKTEYFSVIQHSPNLSKYENTSNEKSPVFSLNTKNYPVSNKILKEKKNFPKGLETVFYLFIDNCLLLVDLPNKKLIFPYQKVNSNHLFFKNEKRGPPYFSFI